MPPHPRHDAHAKPPESMRALFKKWQKSSVLDIDASDEIVDAAKDALPPEIQRLTPADKDHASSIAELMIDFAAVVDSLDLPEILPATVSKQGAIEIKTIPGRRKL